MRCGLVVFIAIVAVVAGDGEWKPASNDQDVKVYHDECVKLIPLTKEQLEKVNDLVFPNEREVHEFALCLVKKLGLFTEERGFDHDRLLAQIDTFVRTAQAPDTFSRKGFLDCADSTVNYANNAERVYVAIKCMWNHIDEIKRQREQNLKEKKEQETVVRR